MTVCGLVCVGLTWMAITNRLDRPRGLYVVLGLFNWAVLPTLALLLGAIPLLGNPKQRA